MGIRRSGAAAAVLLAGLTACASQGSAASDEGGGAKAPVVSPASKSASGSMSATPATPYMWETWPPADLADVARPAPTGEIVEFTSPPPGLSIMDLLHTVSEKTGAVLVYDDQTNQKLKTARLQFFGTWRVQRSGLLDMCRAALSQNNMVMVPLGPASVGEAWSVVDMNNPAVKFHPVWLPENQVLGYADCDGLYVVTTFRIRDTVDSSRVRQALTSLTTQTASIGRIQDAPGARAVIVGDFAPVVAAMKRIVDEINRVATAPPPPSTTPGAPK